MIQHDAVLEVFIEETIERLHSIEAGLLVLEKKKETDPNLINSIFRDAHSVKAGANLLKLSTIEKLAHALENVLEQIRQKKLVPNEMIFTACLESLDKLRELVDNVDQSDSIPILLQTSLLEMATKKALAQHTFQ